MSSAKVRPARVPVREQVEVKRWALAQPSTGTAVRIGGVRGCRRGSETKELLGEEGGSQGVGRAVQWCNSKAAAVTV